MVGFLALVCLGLFFWCWLVANRSARSHPEIAIGAVIAGSLFFLAGVACAVAALPPFVAPRFSL